MTSSFACWNIHVVSSLPQIRVCYRQFRRQQEPRLAYSIHYKSQHDHGWISSETDRYQGHSMLMTGSGQPPLNPWLRVLLSERIIE